MEMAGAEVLTTSSVPNRLVSRTRPIQPRPTAEGLLAASSNQSVRNIQIHCVYCSKSHWSDECSNHVTLQARKEKLRGCCYNCLKRGHTLKDCTKNRACAHCGKRKSHHRSLCQKLFERQTPLQPIWKLQGCNLVATTLFGCTRLVKRLHKGCLLVVKNQQPCIEVVCRLLKISNLV